MLKGPSGCGKTSLLRMLAGLWTFGSQGKITAPDMAQTLFVPQRPYVPQGTLREAVCYPHIETDDATLRQTLQECSLGHLAEHLDSDKDWQHILSPGELQRVAFARILMAKPQMILLDEATAALDEPTEAHLYRLIRERLPDSIMVSIGHRNTLTQFHQRSMDVLDGCPS